MRHSRYRRPLLLLTAAVAVFALTGAGGGGLKAASRSFAIHFHHLLVWSGVVHESALLSVLTVVLGVFLMLGAVGLALDAGFWLTFDNGADANMSANWERWRVPAAVLTVGGLTGGALIVSGSVPEHSHRVGTGLIATAGVFFASLVVLAPRRRDAAVTGVLALTAFAGAGWWYSVPPSDETVAADRLALRGAEVTWERVGDEKHATRVEFLDDQDEALKRGDAETFIADLRRLPHLREVTCSIFAQLPGAVFDRIEAEFPSVKVSGTLSWNQRKTARLLR
jgi:hypothetical protein